MASFGAIGVTCAKHFWLESSGAITILKSKSSQFNPIHGMVWYVIGWIDFFYRVEFCEACGVPSYFFRNFGAVLIGGAPEDREAAASGAAPFALGIGTELLVVLAELVQARMLTDPFAAIGLGDGVRLRDRVRLYRVTTTGGEAQYKCRDQKSSPGHHSPSLQVVRRAL